MKIKSIIAHLGILTLSLSLLAGEVKPIDPVAFYSAKEWQVDVYGSAECPATSAHFVDDARLGLGVGANYFPLKNIGVGAAVDSTNPQHSFIDSARLNLIGRLPIGTSGFAPYFLAGCGYDFERTDFFMHEGLGAEFRFYRRGKIGTGLFIEAEGQSFIKEPLVGIGRVGVRVTF